MKDDIKWTYAIGDEEDYRGVFFNTKEDALEEARNEMQTDDSYSGNEVIWVGKVKTFTPVVSVADELLYELQDQAYDEVGDLEDGWLDNVKKEDQDELDNSIQDCFMTWLEKHPEYKPDFFIIEDSESYPSNSNKS